MLIIRRGRHQPNPDSRLAGLFLDLDGVLWPDLGRPRLFKIWIKRRERHALKALMRSFDICIVVSNQTYGAWHFKSFYKFKLLSTLRFRLFLLLWRHIDAVYACPHHPNSKSMEFRAECECRKPKGGLFDSAARDYGLNLSLSVMVGDRITDLYASHASGIRNNYLITNPAMFKRGDNPNFNFARVTPYFQFISQLSDVNSRIVQVADSDFAILYLSAGLGTRLRPLTINTPKPLIELNGEKILNRLVRQFHEALVSSAHFSNISYLAEKFSEADSNFVVKFGYESEQLGSAISLNHLLNYIPEIEKLIVVHADLVLSDNYISALSEKLISLESSTVFFHERKSGQARSHLTVSPDGHVLDFINRSNNDLEINNVNSGIYFFIKSDLCDLDFGDKGSQIADSLLNQLISTEKLMAIALNEDRVSVENPESLMAARKII